MSLELVEIICNTLITISMVWALAWILIKV